jgi:hypothetical protein
MGAAALLFYTSFVPLRNLNRSFFLNQAWVFGTIQQLTKTCKNTQFKAYNKFSEL